MGLFDDLFGGETTQSSERLTTTARTPYQPGRIGELSDRLWGLGATPQQFFPGQTYADMTPQQRQALAMMEQQATGAMPGMLEPAQAAWQSMLTAPDVANNPYVQGMLETQREQAGRQFMEDINPAITGGAIGAGQLGGTRQGVAQGLAASRTQQNLLDAMRATQLGAYGQGLAQQRYGLGALPQMLSTSLTPAQTLAGVGQTLRAEDQRGITEDMQRFQFGQEEPWQRTQRLLGTYLPLVQPYDVGTNQMVGETTQQQSPGILGGLGQLAGLGVSLFGGPAGAAVGSGLGGFLGGLGSAMAPAAAGIGAGMGAMPALSPVAATAAPAFGGLASSAMQGFNLDPLAFTR